MTAAILEVLSIVRMRLASIEGRRLQSLFFGATWLHGAPRLP